MSIPRNIPAPLPTRRVQPVPWRVSVLIGPPSASSVMRATRLTRKSAPAGSPCGSPTRRTPSARVSSSASCAARYTPGGCMPHTHTSQTTYAANGASDIHALQHALNAILQDFAALAARLGRKGLHSHSIHSIHSGYPHIGVRPVCPLCGETRSAVEQNALGLFAETYAAANPAERQNLVWALCPSDHRLSFASMSQLSQSRRVAAFPQPPTPRPLTDHDGWWQVPGHSTRGGPFVRSLLDAASTTSTTSGLPDQFCPLCWAQAYQEQMLAAVMQQGLPYTEGGRGRSD